MLWSALGIYLDEAELFGNAQEISQSRIAVSDNRRSAWSFFVPFERLSAAVATGIVSVGVFAILGNPVILTTKHFR